MVIKFREHWFGILISLLVAVFFVFVIIVASAPHNDLKMRGFTPCTYAMAEELNDVSETKKMFQVMGAVTHGYLCYAKVVSDGALLWVKGEQETPWANYLFEAENYLATPEESEPLSEDLLKANLLDDDNDEKLLQNDELKELINGEN